MGNDEPKVKYLVLRKKTLQLTVQATPEEAIQLSDWQGWKLVVQNVRIDPETGNIVISFEPVL